MQMTYEQVWDDMSRFAQAMKRGATVVFNDGSRRPMNTLDGKGMCFPTMANAKGIREIIEPPQKKIRPLNAEEWRDVGCCLLASPAGFVGGTVNPMFNAGDAETYEHYRATCHPPGNSKDVRKLWVEE